MTKLDFLNVGCGTKFHPDWYNVDLKSFSSDVIEYNILEGLPFADNTFEVVYHSQVIEHIFREDAGPFISECFRVLKPGGILRVVTPDLENIASEYLKKLELAVADNSDINRANYEWILLELFDQTVRNQRGGQMSVFLAGETDEHVKYAVDRIGFVGTSHRKKTNSSISIPSFFDRAKNKVSNLPQKLRRRFLQAMLTKDELKKLSIGEFRLGGEIHYWLYDRYSLKQLLEMHGFGSITLMTPFTSSIKDWDFFQLDVKNGAPFDPTSLFMEAIKK